MKFYRYPVSIQMAKIGGWLMIAIILAFAALAVFAMLSNPLALIQSPLEILPLLLGLLYSAGVSMAVANNWPTIGVDEHGILVEFLWHYFRIPWGQVTEVKQLPTVFGITSVWLVRTSKLTLFHRLYGFPHPGFFIHAAMNNHEELIAEIERRVTGATHL